MAVKGHKSWLERGGNIAMLLLCATAITVLLRRESTNGDRADSVHADWRSLLSEGTRIGPETAPVQVIAFGDFQCSGCRAFAEAWDVAKKRYADSIALTYVHYPLMQHQFAVAAAVATECAGRQGHYSEYYSILYAQQDSIGIKSFSAYAIDAFVADTVAFGACLRSAATLSLVQQGVDAGRRIGVRATPTVIINGTQLGRAPQRDELLEMIGRALLSKPLRK